MTDPTPLRRVLTADAAVCAAFAALLLVAPGPIAGLTNLPPGLLLGTGAALVPIAAFVGWLATRPVPPRRLVTALVALDALWAVESVAILALGWVAPNALGTGFVLAQAALVAGFGAATWAAARAPVARMA